MPAPRTPQARISMPTPFASPSMASPAAKRRLESESALRPPCRSIWRPANGPRNAEMNSAPEKAAKTNPDETYKSLAIEAARMAGR